MAYTINKTDGSTLVTLIDGTTDNTTNLTLIGKNYTGFGEQVNENFVKLLENFAGRSEPTRPLIGQLWYDTVSARLMVYTPTGWKAAGGPVVQSQSPLNFSTGDMWIDNNENQLYFFDGSDLILAGPIWKKSQGKTGWVSDIVTDVNKNTKSVLYLYVANSLIGIWSAEEFTPFPGIDGFTKIYKGYTANSEVNTVINSTVSNTKNLNNLPSSAFMRSNETNRNTSKIIIQSDDGLTLGATQIVDLTIQGTTLVIENTSSGGDIAFKTKNNTGTYNPIYVDSGTNRVGIFTSSPQQTLDVAGSLRVRGNFIVEGDTVTLSTSTLTVEDRTIELATSEVPSDEGANLSGIVIKASTDKSILWVATNDVFVSTSNFALNSGKVYAIGTSSVLSETSLGPTVTDAPGLTSVGTLIDLTVDDININNNRISSVIDNQDIELQPLGTGNLSLIGSPRITGLGEPVSANDAATRIYSETYAKSLPLTLSIIDNGIEGAIDTNIVTMLNQIAPPIEFVIGKKAYIHVQHIDFISFTISRYVKECTILLPGDTWEVTSTTSSNV